METIDLINLRNFARRTGQPTHPELLDARPIEHVNKIEIDEEHLTIEFDEKTTRFYNANEITKREWVYKYNDNPEFVKAIGKVIDLARKHLKEMPENVACPPGCAECCSGYEPFVSKADVERIADHFGVRGARLDDDLVRRRMRERHAGAEDQRLRLRPWPIAPRQNHGTFGFRGDARRLLVIPRVHARATCPQRSHGREAGSGEPEDADVLMREGAGCDHPVTAASRWKGR